jgi:uncharacterized protein (DUF58 family)
VGGGTATLIAIGAFLFLFLPSPALQWVGIFLVLVLGASFLWSRLAYKYTTARRESSRSYSYRFEEGETCVLVENSGFLAVPFCAVIDRVEGLYTKDAERRIISLKAGEQHRLRTPLRGNARGAYRLGPVIIRSADPIGLFPWTKEVEAEGEHVIYPRILRVSMTPRSGLPGGNLSTEDPRFADPSQFRAVRAYVPGDDPRSISWKISARSGELQVLNVQPSLSAPILAIVNLSLDNYERKLRLLHCERVLEAAASLVADTVAKGGAVGLMTTGSSRFERDSRRFPPAAGEAHARAILAHLAAAEPVEGRFDALALFEGLGTLPFGTRLVYLGPTLPKNEVTQLISLLAGRGMLELAYVDRRRLEAAVDGIRHRRLALEGEPILA